MSELCPPCGTSGSPSMGSYQRHYYQLGSVIRNTVSQAQDTLYRLRLGRETQRWLDVVERMRPLKSMGPPKTLGELCIELKQDSMESAMEIERRWMGLISVKPYIDMARRDIQELRTKMYHKHTDPIKEKKLDRIEGILSMVINDLSCWELCKTAGEPQ